MKYLIVFLCLFFGLNVQAATTEGVSYDPLTRVVKQDDLKEQFANIRVTSTITNDSLSANTVVFSSSAKALGSIAPGNSGDVLTSAGAGVAPSFNPASGLNNWKDSGTTNSTLAGIGYPYGLVVTNTVEVGQSGEAGGIGIQNSSNVVVLTLTNISGLGALVFGPDTTNVLYRSGSDLVYTNGDSIPLFKVVNGSGANATMGLNAGGSAVLNSSSGAIYFDSRQVTKGIGPLTHNLYTIGSAGTAYSDIHSISNVVHSKFDAGGTNYSLVNMYHTGTNGNVVFDSEGSGTAGGAREFLFSANGTTRALIGFTQTNRDGFMSDGSKLIVQKPNLFMGSNGQMYLYRSTTADTSGSLKEVLLAPGNDLDEFAALSQPEYIFDGVQKVNANNGQTFRTIYLANSGATDSFIKSESLNLTSGTMSYYVTLNRFTIGNLWEQTDTNLLFSTDTTVANTSKIFQIQNNKTDKLTVLGNGALTLSGTTNQLTMSSSQLLFNGTAVASSGSGGNVFNTGTPAVNAVARYSDTTGTNIVPTSVTITSATNIVATGALSLGTTPATTALLNFGTNASGGVLLQSGSQSGNSTNVGMGWVQFATSAGQAAGAAPNENMQIGINVGSTSGQVNTNFGQIKDSWELNYKPSTTTYSERHLQYIDGTTGIQYRPIHMEFPWNSPNNSLQKNSINSVQWYQMTNSSGSPYCDIRNGVFDLANDVAGTGGLQIQVDTSGGITARPQAGTPNFSLVSGWFDIALTASRNFDITSTSGTTKLNNTTSLAGNTSVLNGKNLYIDNTGSSLDSIRLNGDAGIDFASGMHMRFSSTTDQSGSKDLGLIRDSAGVLRVSNGSTGVGQVIRRLPTIVKTTNYTATASEEIILLGADALTLTLPTAASLAGRTFTVKTIAPATSGTVATTSSQTIDGSTTYSLSASNKYVRVVSDATNYWIIANN